MKKMVILAMLVGFLSAESIDGFRNMRWGDGIEKLGNYTVVNNLGDTKRIIAIKNDDTLKIGDATLTKIEYHFFDNQFFAVSIQYQDYKTNDILIQTIEMKYGNLDYKNDKNIRKYVDGYKIQGDKIVENIEYRITPNRESPTLWDKEKNGAIIRANCNEQYACKLSIFNKNLAKISGKYDAKIYEELQKVKDEEAKKSIEKGLNDL